MKKKNGRTAKQTADGRRDKKEIKKGPNNSEVKLRERTTPSPLRAPSRMLVWSQTFQRAPLLPLSPWRRWFPGDQRPPSDDPVQRPKGQNI